MGLQRGIKGSREREVSALDFCRGRGTAAAHQGKKKQHSIIHEPHCAVRKAAAPRDEDSHQAKGKKQATWLVPNVCVL